MTAPLTLVRQGVATALDDVPGLTAYATVPADPRPPFAIVGWPQIRYGQHGPAGDEWTIPVQLGVGLKSTAAATARLEALVARGVVKAALEADPTLGGVCNELYVDDCTTGFDVDTGHLTAVFSVRLYVTEPSDP